QAWDRAAVNTSAIELSLPTVPEREPPLLFVVSLKVLCQVPVSCEPLCEIDKRSVPGPAKLSWIVPVHVPVRFGSSSPEQPRRARVKASTMLPTYLRHNVLVMVPPSCIT